MKFSGYLVCLHGFLGQAQDWDPVIPDQISAQKLELFSNSGNPFPRPFHFHTSANWLNSEVAVHQRTRVIAGYSLGGRIAMHALVASPEVWQGAILLSTHPGLLDASERVKRLEVDQKWSERFRKENWRDLISEWNDQLVFQGGVKVPDRMESEFDRLSLAEALIGYSLGNQEDLRHGLATLRLPILWLVGEKDDRYTNIAQKVALINPNIQLKIVPGAGHRLLLEQPHIVKELIDNFLNAKDLQ